MYKQATSLRYGHSELTGRKLFATMCHLKKKKKTRRSSAGYPTRFSKSGVLRRVPKSRKYPQRAFFFFLLIFLATQKQIGLRSSVRVVFCALEEARKLCKRTRPLASATRSCAERIQRCIIRRPYDFHNSAILRRVRRTRRCLNDRPREHCSNVLRVPFYLCDRTTVGAHRNGVRHDSSQITREG